MRRSISLQDFEGAGTDDGASVDSADVSMRRVRSMQNLREGGAGSPTPSAGHTGARLPVLSERELREHFNRPLNEVAKKYGMCTTALKKLCRRYGVMQWPHRRLRSLEKKIASLKAEQRYTVDGQGALDAEILKLENQREALFSGNGEFTGEEGEGVLHSFEEGQEQRMRPGQAQWPNDRSNDVQAQAQRMAGLELQQRGGMPGHQRAGQQQQGYPGGGGPGGMWSGGGAAGNPGRAAGHSAQVQQSADEEVLKTRINTLEEENQSLRALLNSLMGNRQSLLNRSDSSAAEIQKLRQTCDQLWRQIQLVRPAGGGGSSGSPAGRSLPPGMSAGGGMGGGMGGGHRGGGMGGGGMPSPGLGSMSPGLSGMSPALNSMGGAHMSPGMAPMGGEDPRGMHGGMQGGVPNMGGRARGPPPMGAPPPMGGGYPGGGQMGMQGPGMKVERGVSGGYGGVAVPGLGGWDPVPSMQRQPSNDMYYEGGGDSAGGRARVDGA